MAESAVPPKPLFGAPSWLYGAALTMFALLSRLSAIIPGWASNTTIGTIGYVGFVVLVGAGMAFAFVREGKRRAWDEEQTAQKAEERQKAIVKVVTDASDNAIAVLRAEIRALRVVQQMPSPEAPQLIRAIETSAAGSFQSFVQYRNALINGFEGSVYYTPPVAPSSHTTESLQRIAENPPTTPEAVQSSIVTLIGVGGTGAVNAPTVTVRNHTEGS